MVQPSLFDPVKTGRQPTMRDVLEWVEANPHAWRYMEHYATEAGRTGKRFGIKAILERVRWEVRYVEGKPYKCDNSLAPGLARLLVKRHPDLKPFLEFRASHFDGEAV